MKPHTIGPFTAIYAILALSAMSFCGCSSAQPASRATTADYEFTVKVSVDENAKTTTVNVPITIGDSAIQSADSKGSTETQTATPTLDVKPDINVNYAQGGGITSRGTGGTSGAAGILESLTADGLSLLKDAVKNKTSGKITLSKKDGTTTTADCKNGACTFSDGTTVSSSDLEEYDTDFQDGDDEIN